MRWLILAVAIAGALAVFACGPSAPASKETGQSAPSSKEAGASAKPAESGAVSKPAAVVDGVRVTVDGQTFDIQGEVKVDRQSASGVNILTIGRNARPSALVGGNGVELEIQTAPGKDGFTTANIAAVTFTVWKGVEFSYKSVGAIPGRSVAGLVLSESSGKLTGSFEDNLTGTLGKMRARIDFGVALPK